MSRASSIRSSQEGLEGECLLPEPSSFEHEKRLSVLIDRDVVGLDDFRRRPSITLRRRYQGTWPSLIRYTLFSILAFISASYYFWRILPDNPSENVHPHPVAASTCESPECVHAASEILYNLDPNYTNIDPCTNFDQYVCGGWRQRHDMRPDQGSIFSGTYMQEDAQTQLRHILESSKAPDSADADNFKKLKDAYDACLDESTIRKRGSEPLGKILAEFEKVYPASSWSAESAKGNLTDAVLYLIQSNIDVLVALSVSSDDRNPDAVALFVNPLGEIGLPAREYYNNTQTVSDYTDVVDKALGGFTESEKPRKYTAKDVVEFETKLANVTPDRQVLQDITQTYNPYTVSETETMLPEISLSNIISTLAPSNYTSDRVIVASPSYMKSLSGILRETPRETVQLFLQWKIIQAYANEIEDPRIEPLREFNNKLAGKDPKSTEERWRKCIRSLDEGLGWSLSRFYVLNAFSESSKKIGDQIVSDIKERFVFVLHQTDWMSPEVRKVGIEKVGNIVQKIGYPTKSPNVLDAGDVQKYYADLKISNGTYFENELAVAKFDVRLLWSKLGKPTDRDEWGMTAPTVNAYYNPSGNEIVFPAGIMQPPVFWGPSSPLYLSYGAFGAVSGHELSHAFDSSGRHYDAIGNYTNWWDNKTTEAFEQRAQCFVDQYSNFTVIGRDSKVLHVNGRLTLGENIADAGGLAAAFHAWKKRDDASSDPSLPGLSGFSKEQLFFVSYAGWWCGKSTAEAAEKGIYADEHAPKSARIMETMANSREFNEAFNCPTKKPVCKLW